MWSSPTSLKWKRPDSLSLPIRWAKFTGKPLENGLVPEFIIQNVTEDLIEPVIRHMLENFLKDEPYSRLLNAYNDPVYVEQISEVYRWVLGHRVGLVCLLENYEELGDELPKIAGCNLTYPIFPDSPDIKVSHPPLNHFLDFVTKALKLVDCFAKYDVPIILYALGLSVDRKCRGHGIGVQLLRARFPLARALGIKVTNVVFSGRFSQEAGRRAGYEVLGDYFACDYLVDGKPIFKAVKDSESMQLQAAVIPVE